MEPEVFLHEKAICESGDVGAGTRIWAFAHILPGARIGRDCNICDGVFVENDVRIGDRVTIKCGVQVWDGVRLEDDVFVGPNATFTNDRMPRSKEYPDEFLETYVRKGASIGANATILPGIEIGTRAMVGAGAVVTRSVPPYAIVVGNPARIVNYVDSDGPKEVGEGFGSAAGRRETGVIDSEVKGVKLFVMKECLDIRGDLTVGEFSKDLPFVPKRYFMVYSVPTENVRGQHAHKACHQFLICASGQCSVLVDDGDIRREYVLDKPNKGVYIPPMIWGVQYKYSKDAVLLVFASHEYENADYLRDYDEWLALVKGHPPRNGISRDGA